MRVLVVEDDPMHGRALVNGLQESGLVISARDSLGERIAVLDPIEHEVRFRGKRVRDRGASSRCPRR